MFLSTHPSRSATRELWDIGHEVESFYPRTPRGVRLQKESAFCRYKKFLSTHPSRSATQRLNYEVFNSKVSIHAPLAECDRELWDIGHEVESFYPRTPRGVRPIFKIKNNRIHSFYPRTPRGVRRNSAGIPEEIY